MKLTTNNSDVDQRIRDCAQDFVRDGDRSEHGGADLDGNGDPKRDRKVRMKRTSPLMTLIRWVKIVAVWLVYAVAVGLVLVGLYRVMVTGVEMMSR